MANTQQRPSLNDPIVELPQPPDDSVSTLEFSPPALQQEFIIASSWDNTVRCWEIGANGAPVARAIQSMSRPVLHATWKDDGNHIFMAGSNTQVSCWDLRSNHTFQVAAHNAPVMACRWISTPTYDCLLTGSWDKTLKFWDLRTPNPMWTLNFPDKAYCIDVDYPLAVVGTGMKTAIVYSLAKQPEMLETVKAFQDQHRCIAIFRDQKNKLPIGFGLGGVEGSVAIHYLESPYMKENFSFKCHRKFTSDSRTKMIYQDIYAVNDMKIHPVQGTVATVGSDSTYVFWNKESRNKMFVSNSHDQPITKCCFNKDGKIFAYSIGYDWSKGHAYNDPSKKPRIFLKSYFDDLKNWASIRNAI